MLVAGVTHTEPKVLAAIKAFQEKGGIVILVDRDKTVLKRNPYDQPADLQVAEAIYQKAVWIEGDRSGISPNPQFSEQISQMLNQYTESEFIVKSSEGNYNIEWTEAECNGEKILNIISHDGKRNRKIQIYRNGILQEHMTEMISGAHVGAEIELRPYQPILLKFEN